uniref:MAT1-1-2 n=1 Tax=Ophiocordyceps robertsii TaxID=169037 RepID=A0A8F2JD62_9HYPO|nr:MAT1-1-2 [Ophiocordyceps robertsii]
MESIISFEPFWKQSDVISTPRDALNDIRERSLNLFLDKHKGEPPLPSSVEGKYFPALAFDHPLIKILTTAVVFECMEITRLLLEKLDDGNEILQRLHTIAVYHHNDAIYVVKGALAMWYSSAIPAVSRDPLQGLNPEALREFDENGDEFDPWSRRFATQQHRAANLGIVAMLMTFKSRDSEAHPLSKAASLVARSVATLLYAVFLICPRMLEETWTHYLESTRPDETIKTFLRSTWSLTRENCTQLNVPAPGLEFGTTLDEVRLTRDGSNLITRIGRFSWHSPPAWHPLRNVPGSPWNKFLRNHSQPIFPETPSQSAGFRVTIPGSLRTLASPFEEYYSELRSRMDQTGRQRRVLHREAQIHQFHSLAEATGRRYPAMDLSEDNASYTEEPVQDFLYKLPMVKKPICDMSGHLTFPFMNTLVRAWRFQDEPDEVEPDFHIMTFER